MLALMKGRYIARLAESASDIRAAKSMRYQCFIAGRPVDTGQGIDTDHFDDSCLQMLIEEAGSGALACTYRLLPLGSGRDIHRSYAAQAYDLERLSRYPAPLLELGRFCIARGRQPDADLLRVAWGAMARIVDAQGVGMLFGCSSLAGADPALHHDALQALARKHLAPPDLAPQKKIVESVDYATNLTDFDPRAATAQTPALLRTYLMMGGWVSDHAVIDRALDTLHVFTGLPIATIPPARARALRALAI